VCKALTLKRRKRCASWFRSMTQINDGKNMQNEIPFIGALRDPFCSPKITQGLVEFKVRQIQGSQLLNKAAKLVNESGEVYPVTVRGIGRMNAPFSDSWQPGDFLVRVDGIDIEKAQEMRELIQELVPEGTTFVGAIIDFQLSLTQPDLIEVRVRPQPYSSLHRGGAWLINQANEVHLVTIRHTTFAPPSVTLGRFGDIIITIDSISLEEMNKMQRVVQAQRKAVSSRL
jgi:hypothetical protein